MRTAFTIVELLVAIVVLTIGVLALAATAGLVATHVGDGGRLTSAAHAARSVIDSLISVPCDRIVSGMAVRGTVPAEWTVTRDSLAVAIEVGVGVELRRGSAREMYRAAKPCERE